MSTSSGSAIRSRNPLKCGALKNSHDSDPIVPSSASCRPKAVAGPEVAAGLRDHQQLPAHLRRRDHRQALADRLGQRLLAEHGKPTQQGIHADLGMRDRHGDVDDRVGVRGQFVDRGRHRHVAVPVLVGRRPGDVDGRGRPIRPGRHQDCRQSYEATRGPSRPRRPGGGARGQASAGSSIGPCVPVAVEEVAGLVPQQRRHGPLRPVRHRPRDAVRDHLADVLVVVHREVLVAGREVEDLPVSAAERAAGPEHLAAGEGRHEDQFVRHRDVEELAVHLLLLDLDRVRHALRDRVRRVHRPDQLAVALTAPAQRARRTHQLAEDLRPVTGVQDDEAHPRQHVLVHALDHLVLDLAVRGVTPPDQYVGLGQHLLGESVLGLVEGRRGDLGLVAQVLADAGGNGVVHAVGVDLGDMRLDLLVPVLAPDEYANRHIFSP